MLRGLRVLLVEDDHDARELLAMLLAADGADVQEAHDSASAVEAARRSPPDVVLSDLTLDDVDGVEILRQIRALPGLENVPAVVLTGRGKADDRGRTLAGGFEKHLVKPASKADIVSALTMVAQRPEAEAGIRAMLARLNETNDCQYTSVLRFAKNGTIVSIWTHDRMAPQHDPFAVGLEVESSYCVLVRDTGQTVVIEDARRDTRVADHPKRDQLAAYLGAPIHRTDGVLYGTLCSYDVTPRSFSAHDVENHERLARELAAAVSPWTGGAAS